MKALLTLVMIMLFVFAGCDLAADTADTSKAGGDGAVGVAEKMSKGTLGDEIDE